MPVHLLKGAAKGHPDGVQIGLLNNMPDGAIKSTERQFYNLLASATAVENVHVNLSLYALPDVPRSAAGLEQVTESHRCLDELWDSPLDALIITGAEPTTSRLSDEPYWETLRRVFDWAEEHTQSTICSCLAAHAAVEHFDGIVRRPLGVKRFGVFPWSKVSEHSLTDGLPARFAVPHSRWNNLAEDELIACGYQVLTRAASDVDLFVRARKSLFIGFQSHPEYEANTLRAEYRRDLGRYSRGERASRPSEPENCFPGYEWHAPAAGLYANWVRSLVQARCRAFA